MRHKLTHPCLAHLFCLRCYRHYAASEGQAEVVRVLLQLGARADAQNNTGCTPLHRAAREGHVEVVRELLEAGASVHSTSNDGNTPMHELVRGFRQGNEAQYLEATRLLLRGGSSATATNSEGLTPLVRALSRC